MPPPVFPITVAADPVNDSFNGRGPFAVGANLYCFGWSGGGGGIQILAYKSIDNGLTWTRVGVATTPVSDASNEPALILVGTKVWATFIGLGAAALYFCAFDTVTDTWGAQIPTTQPIVGTDQQVQTIARADGTIVVVSQAGDGTIPTIAPPGVLRCGYVIFDTNTLTCTNWAACGTTANTNFDWVIVGITLGAGGRVHIFMNSQGSVALSIDPTTVANTLYQQPFSSGNILGAIQTIVTSPLGTVNNYPINTGPTQSASDGVNVLVSWQPVNSSLVGNVLTYFGASADIITFTAQSFTQPNTAQLNAFAVVIDGTTNYIFLTNSDGVMLTQLVIRTDTGGGWGPQTLVGTFPDNNNGNIAASLRFPGDWLWQGQGSLLFWSLFGAPPAPPPPVPKSTVGGGTYFPRFVNKTLLHAQIARIVGPVDTINYFRDYPPLYWMYDYPNGNDLCLSREWRLYNQIDPQALSCARKPDCFTGEEGARPWVEPPPGAITFNPDKAIPLPAPALVNVVVLSFRVPIAYDGILLAQYHAYRGAGTFTEGSGDIIWRVRVNGRFLRDMGNMELSIGSPQTLSPCPGGLWLHSGNLVEYVVSAPNGSGALPLPGQGNILAGLHGWFWPRI